MKRIGHVPKPSICVVIQEPRPEAGLVVVHKGFVLFRFKYVSFHFYLNFIPTAEEYDALPPVRGVYHDRDSHV